MDLLLRMGQRNLVVVSSSELAMEVLHIQGVEFGSREVWRWSRSSAPRSPARSRESRATRYRTCGMRTRVIPCRRTEEKRESRGVEEEEEDEELISFRTEWKGKKEKDFSLLTSYGPFSRSVNFGLGSCLAWAGCQAVLWAGAHPLGPGLVF